MSETGFIIRQERGFWRLDAVVDSAMADQFDREMQAASEDQEALDLLPDAVVLKVLTVDERLGNEDFSVERLNNLNRLMSFVTPMGEDYERQPFGNIRQLEFGLSRFSDGRLGMMAEIRRPKMVTDAMAVHIATTVMRSVAMNIGYMDIERDWISDRREMINQLVGVSYDTARGVTLTTNPLGSCSIDTDGSTYDPNSDFVELWQHNLYERKQQVILLFGAIAVANAETLVEQID